MDRMMLLEHLAQAERHVAEGVEHVARQREVVARLERDKQDATSSRELLQRFEEMQAMHLTDRDRILRELAR
jgi:hypothetical protein